ncbi:MAG: helix-turn-helix transcriptional regulator [Pseudomonadota bacterium]
MMPLPIDFERLKELRARRAWTQQQLAEVSGLSLRTIQRIESRGQASQDSLQALAAVLDVSSAELLADSPPKTRARKPAGAAGGALAGALLMLLALSMSSVTAQPIMLNVAIAADDAPVFDAQLLSSKGKDSEVRLPGTLRIQLEPAVTDDGNVFVAVRLYEPDQDGQFELVAEPAVLTEDGKPTAISFDARSGRRYDLTITPEL